MTEPREEKYTRYDEEHTLTQDCEYPPHPTLIKKKKRLLKELDKRIADLTKTYKLEEFTLEKILEIIKEFKKR